MTLAYAEEILFNFCNDTIEKVIDLSDTDFKSIQEIPLNSEYGEELWYLFAKYIVL